MWEGHAKDKLAHQHHRWVTAGKISKRCAEDWARWGCCPKSLSRIEVLWEARDKTIFVIQKGKLPIDHGHDGQLSCWENLRPDKMIDIVINDTRGLWQVNEVSLSHCLSKISLWLFRQMYCSSPHVLHLQYLSCMYMKIPLKSVTRVLQAFSRHSSYTYKSSTIFPLILNWLLKPNLVVVTGHIIVTLKSLSSKHSPAQRMSNLCSSPWLMQVVETNPHSGELGVKASFLYLLM